MKYNLKTAKEDFEKIGFPLDQEIKIGTNSTRGIRICLNHDTVNIHYSSRNLKNLNTIRKNLDVVIVEKKKTAKKQEQIIHQKKVLTNTVDFFGIDITLSNYQINSCSTTLDKFKNVPLDPRAKYISVILCNSPFSFGFSRLNGTESLELLEFMNSLVRRLPDAELLSKL